MGIAPHPDQLDVERANLALYRAFESLDLHAMSELWVQDESASCVHPGWAPLRGWEAVRESWSTIFANTERIRFTLSELDVLVSGALAVVRLVEHIESEAGGEAFHGRAVATNVFVRGAGSWLLVHHHASSIALVEDEDEASTTLH